MDALPPQIIPFHVSFGMFAIHILDKPSKLLHTSVSFEDIHHTCEVITSHPGRNPFTWCEGPIRPDHRSQLLPPKALSGTHPSR